MPKLKALKHLLTISFLLYGIAANASVNVNFSGFAFLGDYAHVKKNYPYSFAVNNSNKSGQPALDASLFEKMKKASFKELNVNLTELSVIGGGDEMSLVFALDRESISVEKLNNRYKVLIELSAQALFYDFETMSIVATYPFTVQYIDSLETPPSSDYKLSTIDKLYRTDGEINVFSKFVDIVSTAKIKRKYKNRIQVTNIELGEKAKPFLPDIYSNDPINLKNFVAQSFSKALSSNQNISVLPYTKGHAIANKMSGSFANGDVFTLSIPEADYEITIDLLGFKKILFSESPVGSSWIYGSFVKLKVVEPMMDKVFMDTVIKNGSTKVIPSTQTSVDDWPAFEESLLILFESLTRELSDPSKKWAKKHTGNKNNVKQMINFKKVVAQCT